MTSSLMSSMPATSAKVVLTSPLPILSMRAPPNSGSCFFFCRPSDSDHSSTKNATAMGATRRVTPERTPESTSSFGSTTATPLALSAS